MSRFSFPRGIKLCSCAVVPGGLLVFVSLNDYESTHDNRSSRKVVKRLKNVTDIFTYFIRRVTEKCAF